MSARAYRTKRPSQFPKYHNREYPVYVVENGKITETFMFSEGRLNSATLDIIRRNRLTLEHLWKAGYIRQQHSVGFGRSLSDSYNIDRVDGSTFRKDMERMRNLMLLDLADYLEIGMVIDDLTLKSAFFRRWEQNGTSPINGFLDFGWGDIFALLSPPSPEIMRQVAIFQLRLLDASEVLGSEGEAVNLSTCNPKSTPAKSTTASDGLPPPYMSQKAPVGGEVCQECSNNIESSGASIEEQLEETTVDTLEKSLHKGHIKDILKRLDDIRILLASLGKLDDQEIC